ncbi:hypothetical protein CEXT_74421 [Caerostris extrusa]|uniref:Uncharacterized protein n=1 Tax=Caerostris extrusa TaxID=172846 RepID=A0AAV4VE31_CAEEX|nr:hypothetical protein CEXT_74421 [Caerostris extrusa]
MLCFQQQKHAETLNTHADSHQVQTGRGRRSDSSVVAQTDRLIRIILQNICTAGSMQQDGALLLDIASCVTAASVLAPFSRPRFAHYHVIDTFRHAPRDPSGSGLLLFIPEWQQVTLPVILRD